MSHNFDPKLTPPPISVTLKWVFYQHIHRVSQKGITLHYTMSLTSIWLGGQKNKVGKTWQEELQVNGLINHDWLNLAFSSIKIKCKNLILT